MRLKGLYVALVTPFDARGEIDEQGFRENIRHLIDKGVAGIVPCGTTGEAATLSWEEHNRVVDCAIDAAGGRVTVIAGAGSNNTRESIEAARHARAAGADAILCITPYYNKPTQEGLYRHFAEIASQVDIGMIVYNVPGRTGVNLRPETIERLCGIPTVIGVKEASGDIEQISEIHRLCGDRLAVLSGDDALTLPILACGGAGVISVAGNIIPERMNAMLNAFFAGDCAEARSIHEEIFPIAKALFLETNPIPVKTAMGHLGFAAGPLRLPLAPMGQDNKQKLLSVLEAGGVRPLR
ncbi:MAG: 4-hydroxy-tetrahydrodipicolinate synthase [Chitinivibrionales bacterium]|nr:4-hydroxy-tetrahydrodipicolinate synthase [Chitinivibrionales bacterium]MBD3397150.1 4-hydroxy-tetrahydrodipicolinate synthase [Chitinivibrionales bacterium]